MCNRRGRTCLETLGSHHGELATSDRRGWLLAGPFTVASGAEGASGGLSERHLCLLGCLPPSSIPRLSSCVSAKPKLILLFFPRIPCPQEPLFCCFSTSPPPDALALALEVRAGLTPWKCQHAQGTWLLCCLTRPPLSFGLPPQPELCWDAFWGLPRRSPPLHTPPPQPSDLL